MYKEINLPEVVGALLVDKKTGKVRVDNVLLSEVQKVIVGEDKFMKVDFSRQQYRRVAYLGGGHVKVEESQSVVIEAGLPKEITKRFEICYNSLDNESKKVLDSSLGKFF